jgi:hypothetical protein
MIGAKSAEATSKEKRKTTRSQSRVARQFSGLGSLAIRRALVAELAMFRDLREWIERISNSADNEKARSYAADVAKSLGEMAAHLEHLQGFVPKASPGDATLSIIDAARSIIEGTALECELIRAIKITCQSSMLFGYEPAGAPRPLKTIKEFQRAQAKSAREAKAKKIAVSGSVQALKAAVEKHLPQPSGRDYKDANSILDSVNEDLANRGLPRVNVDKVRRLIRKHRAL